MGMDFDKVIEDCGVSPEKVNALFRMVSSESIIECGSVKCTAIKDIKLSGKNTDLTESMILDIIVVLSADEGEEVGLVNQKSAMIAKMFSKGIPKKISLEAQRAYVYGSLGIEGYTQEGAPDGEDEEDSTGELDSSKEKPAESDKDLEKKIHDYYGQYGFGVASELIKRYTSLFSSGYEVIKPAGLLVQEGITKLSGSSRIISENSVATKNMYMLFKQLLGFTESQTRSIKGISSEIYRGYSSGAGVLYFSCKMLEFAYGRCAPDGDNQESANTYKVHSSAKSWKGYVSEELNKSIKYLVDKSILGYVLESMKSQGVEYDDSVIADGLGGFLQYLSDCLSICLLLPEYKVNTINGERSVSAFKVRVCDPQNRLGYKNYIEDILKSSFLGGVGSAPFSYDARIEEEVFVKEYAHEFNHDVSQAMPLFAYKALESLQSSGMSLSWNEMILGMFEDGSILRNGKHGVDMGRKLVHQTDAGSRAGKGVMTLNMLASGIASKKLVAYADRKPDMASLLKFIASNMCVMNGGGYSEQYDQKYKQFTNLNSLLNYENIPDMVADAFQVTPTWDDLGDIFYMRFLKLFVGIIVARGEGRFGDELLGGSHGVLLVLDEFKNFQDSFSNLVNKAASIIPPTTVDKDKEALEKGSISQSTFNRSYNDAGYYALSFLNSLSEDMRFLSEKTDAGFNQEEISLSDIVIIGQSLDKGPADRMAFADSIRNAPGSARYRSVGSFGLKGFSMGNQSIPYSLVSFKPADAFFGRNRDDGRSVYLAQTNPKSKACGRLDDKASNFAYMADFTEDKRKKIVAGGVADNIALANSCTYFKPFLILNTGDPGDDCVKGCIARCYQNGGISEEELIAEYPNENGTAMNSAIGFEDYLRMAGMSDYKEVLERSSTVANYVVQDLLGYPGDWFAFITDLRPQWLFTIRDIAESSKGAVPKLANPTSNPVLEEFVAFNPSIFGVGEGTVDDSGGGSFEDAFGEESTFGSEDIKEGTEAEDFSDFDNQMSEVGEDLAQAMGDFESYGEDEEFLLYDEAPEVQETGTEEEPQGLDESAKEILKHIEELKKLGVDVQVGQNGWQVQEPIERVDNRSDLGESVSQIRYSDDVESLSSIMNIITQDVIDKFGGLDRVNSFKVLGGSIAINGCFYRCRIDGAYASKVPFDLRKDINSGNICKLFNYTTLRSMNRVRDLEFDSVSFVYDYVSPALGYTNNISVNKFFEDIPSLQVLTIGKSKFSRGTYQNQLEESEDIFYKPSRADSIAKASQMCLGRFGSRSWKFTKDMATKENCGMLVKILGVGAGLTGTAVGKVGEGGISLGRKATKGLKAFTRGLSDLFNT